MEVSTVAVPPTLRARSEAGAYCRLQLLGMCRRHGWDGEGAKLEKEIWKKVEAELSQLFPRTVFVGLPLGVFAKQLVPETPTLELWSLSMPTSTELRDFLPCLALTSSPLLTHLIRELSEFVVRSKKS